MGGEATLGEDGTRLSSFTFGASKESIENCAPYLDHQECQALDTRGFYNLSTSYLAKWGSCSKEARGKRVRIMLIQIWIKDKQRGEGVKNVLIVAPSSIKS